MLTNIGASSNQAPVTLLHVHPGALDTFQRRDVRSRRYITMAAFPAPRVLLFIGLLSALALGSSSMQQGPAKTPDLEHQLSMFLDDLAEAVRSLNARMLALETENKALRKLTEQQGAAQMQELEGMRQGLDFAWTQDFHWPFDADVPSEIARAKAKLQKEREDAAQRQPYLDILGMVAGIAWRLYKLVLIGMAWDAICQALYKRVMKRIGRGRTHKVVDVCFPLVVIALSIYLLYRFPFIHNTFPFNLIPFD